MHASPKSCFELILAGKHSAFSYIFSQCFFVWRERLLLVLSRADSKKKVITGVQDKTGRIKSIFVISDTVLKKIDFIL
jgi:hypothetical protein